MEKIIVKIDKKTFDVIIDMVGYSGTECLKDIEELQSLLKADTIDERLKEDVFDVRITKNANSKIKY